MKKTNIAITVEEAKLLRQNLVTRNYNGYNEIYAVSARVYHALDRAIARLEKESNQ